jgi:hypothetical protein
MNNPSLPVIRKPAQGRTFAVVGDVYRFLVIGGRRPPRRGFGRSSRVAHSCRTIRRPP